ncbi:phage/plasmid primase, P4 family, partial [Aeromonas sanarellii]
QNDLTPMILAQTVGKEIQEIGQMLIKQACKKEELSWAYAVLRHGSSSLNRAGIQNMLELAKPMMTARLHELNANPMLLGTANGVIDLKSGRLLAPRRAFMMTHHSPVAYDPTATCLRWEQFISEITCGDVEYAAFLQRCVGYWITGRTDEQLLFFLHGGGCNGKSTFMSIIQQLLGEFSRQISSNVLLFNRNGNAGPNPSLTKLVDARLVVANELPEGSRMDENLVKAMTGDDVIVARAPYAKKEMEFRPSFSLVMVGNHKPEIRDTSNGMWRRMLMLPFNASFTKAQLDPMLMEKLRAEMPGILNWAIQGCQMWQEQRLKASIPARLKQDVETYRAESDMVGCFLEECTQARAGAKVPMSEVYAAYGRWAQQNGEWVMKQLALKKKLAEKGLVTTRYNNKVTVIGLTLLDSEMADMTVSARREQPELGGNYTV